VVDYLHCVKNQSATRNTDVKLATPDKNGDLPPLPEKLRANLEQENAAAIKEGMDALNKAIELKPNYDEAMAYLNLLYRQKADIESDPGARASDIKNANDWLAKAMEARKQSAAQPTAASSTGH
jgi:hypothetical protein